MPAVFIGIFLEAANARPGYQTLPRRNPAMRSASRSPGLAVIHQNNPAVIVAIMAVGVLQRRAILQIDNLLHLQHRIGRFAVKMLFIQFPGFIARTTR